MTDYHKIGTDQLRALLRFKAQRYNRLLAGELKYRSIREDDLLKEQMSRIKAVLFSRENTIKMFED